MDELIVEILLFFCKIIASKNASQSLQSFVPSLLPLAWLELASESVPDQRSNQLSYRGTDTTSVVKQEIYLAGKRMM